MDPDQTEDPNHESSILISAGASGNYLACTKLGGVRSAMAFLLEDSDNLDSNLFRWDPGPEREVLRYDPSLGLFVYERIIKVRQADGSASVQMVVLYAGPEGISGRWEERLGRFISPIADRVRLRSQVVYDRGMRRFFAIDWEENASGVRKGPQLGKDVACQPIQIGAICKNIMAINLSHPKSFGSDLWRAYDLGDDQIFVLDASGRIDRLDMRTLELAGVAGRLAIPTAPIGSIRNAGPEDVAAYVVQALAVFRGRPGMLLDGGGEWVYGGCAVASLSRDGLAVQLDCFDPNGQLIASDGTTVHTYDTSYGTGVGLSSGVPSAKAAYFVLPGSRTLTWMEFICESLHPPVLVLASYFAGPHFEATAGYRSLFLLPDSFVAMIARGGGDITPWERFLWAFGYMLPGLLLFGLLAVKVERDGIRMGTPRNTRKAWVVATIALGLPAYVTYRLTRPTVALVTCRNCGQGRRADFEKCQHCGATWSVPELSPPSWRVLGEPESIEEGLPSRTEETGLPA
jgi:hypothetical protein